MNELFLKKTYVDFLYMKKGAKESSKVVHKLRKWSAMDSRQYTRKVMMNH
jgi:hypothetical protein